MKRHSLTIRLAVLFALLSFAVLSLIGVTFYHGLEKQLTSHDDAVFVTRAEQIRKLLQRPGTVKFINENPLFFQSMLGNHGSLLVVRSPGKAPIIAVNPDHLPVPDLQPVTANSMLSTDALHRSKGPSGMPFITVAVTAHLPDSGQAVEIIVGSVMEDRALLLKNCRDRILIQISVAALLFALAGYWLVRRGLLPLRNLVEQTEKITVTNLFSRIEGNDAPAELTPVIDSFNAMLGRLHTGFAQLSQVSADMAHDLRTPINNLLGQTEVALSQSRTADQYEALLVSNMEELQRLSKMTDSMLFLARSENANTEIERKRLDVSVELQCVTEYFEVLAEERGLTIVTQGNGAIFADPMLLRRALANLMANAVQYADKETTIHVRSDSEKNGSVVLSVENRGPTIEAQPLDRVFDRFYRADASRRGSADASGLGLSIVKSIMLLHQGSCRVTCIDGLTCFSLFFPGIPRGKMMEGLMKEDQLKGERHYVAWPVS